MVSKVGWLFGVQDPFTVRLQNPGVGVGPGRLGGEGWSPGVARESPGCFSNLTGCPCLSLIPLAP